MKIADTSAQDVVIERSPRRKRRLMLVLGGSLTLALLLALLIPSVTRWSKAQASVPMERLRIATVTQADLIRDISIQGRVVAAVSPTLYAPADGIVSYQVNAGDTVAKGDVLAVIDSPDLQNQLQQEQATLDRLSIAVSRQHIDSRQLTLENKKAVDIARVTLTAAQREKRRADKAWQVNAISQIDYEKAQDELENAQLVFQHAEADAQLANESQRFELQTRELELSRQRLLVADLRRRTDALSITSPVAGMVGNLSLQQKNQVTRHQALLSVVDLSAYEVEIAIPESYADDLALGMAAEIHYNGERHAATLIAISPEIQDNQVIGRVRFADSMPAGLRQSQRLTTRVLLENKANVLQVSRGQFINSGAGRVAYRVQDGIAYRTAITIGATSLNAVEIIDGLQLGDRIIISDTEPFASADTVRLTD